MPEVFGQFVEVVNKLESHYRDMQDIEFTVEQGRALDAADPQRQAHRQVGAEGRRRSGGRGRDHHRKRPISRVEPSAQLDQLLHPTLDPEGRPHRASPPACRPRRAPPPARSCSTPTRPSAMAGRRGGHPGARGDLARKTSTACTRREGIVTARGGMTSHAAVVARGMGRACVLRRRRDPYRRGQPAVFTVARPHLQGLARSSPSTASKGEVLDGAVAKMIEPELTGDFARP